MRILILNLEYFFVFFVGKISWLIRRCVCVFIEMKHSCLIILSVGISNGMFMRKQSEYNKHAFFYWNLSKIFHYYSHLSFYDFAYQIIQLFGWFLCFVYDVAVCLFLVIISTHTHTHHWSWMMINHDANNAILFVFVVVVVFSRQIHVYHLWWQC